MEKRYNPQDWTIKILIEHDHSSCNILSFDTGLSEISFGLYRFKKS